LVFSNGKKGKEKTEYESPVGEVYCRTGTLPAVPLLGKVMVGIARRTVYL
jgi:hypothetical protein